jgi:hypothetical protein
MNFETCVYTADNMELSMWYVYSIRWNGAYDPQVNECVFPKRGINCCNWIKWNCAHW